MKKKTLSLFFVVSFSISCSPESNSLSDVREYPFIQPIEDTSRLVYGYLPVPENHANPAGRQIEIAWTVVKSKDPASEKHPLIY